MDINKNHYRLTEENPKYKWDERILLFIYEKDIEAGRNLIVDDWYDDLRETLFRYSARFIHSTDLILMNTIYWNEMEEYGHPYTGEGNGIKLPPLNEAVANITNGNLHSFRMTLKKLYNNQMIYAFILTMRALQGVVGKSTPFPELWMNKYKLNEIRAISLTEKGFYEAKRIYDECNVLKHWQVHKKIIDDKDFAEFLYKKKMHV